MKQIYLLSLIFSTSLFLVACGGGSESPEPQPQPAVVQTSVDPVAITSSNFNIYSGSIATLDGSGSYDSDGTISSYSWSQIEGTPVVTLSSPNSELASFTAPTVSSDTPLKFELTITDNDGLTSNASIIITIQQKPTILTYYVSDCGVGADPDCQPGDDSNDGISPATAWRTYDRAQDKWSNLVPGESILFARGGVYEVVGSNQWVNTSSTVNDPVTLSDYQPNWGSGNEQLPRIVQNQNDFVFSLADGGSAEVEQGYVFKNLYIQCNLSESNNKAFFLYNDVDDVTIDTVTIDSCRIGVHAATSNPCSSSAQNCNGKSDRLTIKNATIINNSSQGFLGSSEDLIIESTDFIANGSESSFDHNIYISNSSGARISGNTLYQSTLDVNGACSGVSLVVHGETDGMIIENNTIYEDLGKANPNCWGISVDPGYNSAEGFTNIIIRNNTITNVGNVSIGIASCENCSIEDNIITQNQAIGVTGINAPVRQRGSNDLIMNEVNIHGNSIHFGADSSGTAISLGTEGTNHQITYNLIRFDGSSGFNCFKFDLAYSSYTDIDFNKCSYESSADGEWVDGVGDLATWQQASGFSQNSENVVPF